LGDKVRVTKRFLTGTQKHTKNGMGRLAALEARQAISGNFLETLNYETKQRKT